jgi:CubicO group peptidase (beta-lactamase class C family)
VNAFHGDSSLEDLATHRISRRQALKIGGSLGTAAVSQLGAWAGPAAAYQATPSATPVGQAIVMTGQAVPELAAFDEVMTGLMTKWHLPGGQLAVAKDGRLVLNRGYGLADVEQEVPVQPENLFWIASAEDLVRFTLAVDGQRGKALLSPEALEAMLTTPRPQESPPGSSWDSKPVTHGLGWDVQRAEGGVTWSHGGALEGCTAALPFHGTDGLVFAFVFNTLPIDFRPFFVEAGQGLLGAAKAVKTWPNHDLFGDG